VRIHLHAVLILLCHPITGVSVCSFLSQSNPDGSQTPLPVDKFQSVFTVWASQYGIISNMDMYCEHVNTGARVDCSAEGAIITASRVVYVQRVLLVRPASIDGAVVCRIRMFAEPDHHERLHGLFN
jgi:hypothetical protein